jgi:hypothetical protein
MAQRQLYLAAMLLLGYPILAVAQSVVPPDYPKAAPTSPSARKSPAQNNPAAVAAQRQSGLSQEQASGLLQRQGYAGISDLRADPNSVWVWQADALKNGRRVRLGIDYRGNVLEISSGLTRPCAAPGIRSGVGGFGVGAGLSEATACGGR